MREKLDLLGFPELKDFLVSRMRLSHIYQPLLIRSLIDCGGTATIRQLATMFLGYDESQILYYEKRLKRMPVCVLGRHGVWVHYLEDIELCVASVNNRAYQEEKDHPHVRGEHVFAGT
jgi:hypothetical protein